MTQMKYFNKNCLTCVLVYEVGKNAELLSPHPSYTADSGDPHSGVMSVGPDSSFSFVEVERLRTEELPIPQGTRHAGATI